MGLSKYRTPYQVWLNKTMGVADDISDKPAVMWGNILEPVVADHFASEHPELRVEEPGCMFRSKSRPWAQASLDRVLTDADGNHGVLEIKTAGLRSEADWDDGVPVYYQTQVQHYLSVTGWKWAYVSVLIGGQDYREYRLERDEEDVAAVDRAVDDFWHDHVETNLPPDTGPEDFSSVVSEHPDPDGDFVVSDDTPTIVRRFVLAKAERDAAEREYKRWGAKVKEAVGDAKGIRSPDGTLTWRRYERSNLDRNKLRSEFPEAWEACQVSSVVDGGLVWRERRA